MTSDRFTEQRQQRERIQTIEHRLAFYRRPTVTWIFSDEAGTHGNARYFGIGGLFVHHRTASGHKFGLELQEMCQSRNWTDEFKWSSVSRGNIHRYKSLVENFFKSPKTVQFYCLIVNRSLLNVGNNKSQEMLFKFYYLLFSHRINPITQWRSTRRCILIPDKMDLSEENYWSNLFYSVNSSLKSRHEIRYNPIVELLPTDSKSCLEIQLADVLVGSIVAKFNGDFRTDHKRELSEMIWDSTQKCDRNKASIWEWQPEAN